MRDLKFWKRSPLFENFKQLQSIYTRIDSYNLILNGERDDHDKWKRTMAEKREEGEEREEKNSDLSLSKWL